MPASIGVNLRVTGHCRQGGRKYMEDFFSVAYQQTEDERDLEYAFFGIYDGHGGAEAAAFAKEHLMETIVKQKNFWSDSDADVLRAIKDGYIATHYAMWKEQEKWPKTASGLPSTAGTTASVAFIRRGKIYIGHVGDSGIILGYQEPGYSEWKARPLTKEHKPESAMEMSRIESCGGKVVSKSGVPRVVWNRPRIGHQGPVRRSTPIDEIPFLAVARSLGDLWSYNSQLDEFVVSPDPDCSVIPIDTSTFRCLIFGTDGLYNMLSPQVAVHIVQQAERHNENAALSSDPNKVGWLNPSKCLVEKALERWSTTKMRADNTSVVTLMLDPPGPPHAQVLKNKKKNSTYPDSGLKIVTRYEDNDEKDKANLGEEKENESPGTSDSVEKSMTSTGVNTVVSCTNVLSDGNDENNVETSSTTIIQEERSIEVKSTEYKHEDVCTTKVEYKETNVCFNSTTCLTDLVDTNFSQKTRESLSYDIRKVTSEPETSNDCCSSSIDQEIPTTSKMIENIQINEISSSSNDTYDIEVEDMASQPKTENNVDTSKSINAKIKTGPERRSYESKSNKDESKKYSVCTRSRNTKNGEAKDTRVAKNCNRNFKTLRSQSSNKNVPEITAKASIKGALRSTKRLAEKAQLISRKRVLPTLDEDTKDACSPRKRLREGHSSTVVPKVARTSNVILIANKPEKQAACQSRKRLQTFTYTKMRAKVDRPRFKSKIKMDTVILKQKIRALQKIMTRQVPSFNSGIIFENRKLLHDGNSSKSKDIETKNEKKECSFLRTTTSSPKPLSVRRAKTLPKQATPQKRATFTSKIGKKVVAFTRRSPRKSVAASKTRGPTRKRAEQKQVTEVPQKNSDSGSGLSSKRHMKQELVRDGKMQTRSIKRLSADRTQRSSERSVRGSQSIAVALTRSCRRSAVLHVGSPRCMNCC